MEKNRKGEIALALLKHHIGEEFTTSGLLWEDLESVAEDTGVSQEELQLFWQSLGTEMTEMLSAK